MDILTDVILPFALALIIAVPGIAGIWHFTSQREKRRAETDSTVVATALSLLEPLEERVKDQEDTIERQQRSIDNLKRERTKANAKIAEQSVRIANQDAKIAGLIVEISRIKERPNDMDS